MKANPSMIAVLAVCLIVLGATIYTLGAPPKRPSPPSPPARFVDNGDGTITDNETGLMWETKQGCVDTMPLSLVNPRCVNNLYSFDSSLFGLFLRQLNGGVGSGSVGFNAGPTNVCFAGHCDWRVPNIVELKTILNLNSTGTACATVPCIDPIFGPTQAAFYWSSTAAREADSNPAGPFGTAWHVFFDSGVVSTYPIGQNNYARAVRGGR
jgi:hypothetical protein